MVGEQDAEAEVTGRLASLLLRAGVDAREIIEQMWRVRTREMAFDKSVDGTTVCVTTVAQGIALAIGRYLYGDGFNPQKEFPRADTLPEPNYSANKQLRLRFNPKTKDAAVAPKNITVKPVSGIVQGSGSGQTKMFAGVCPDCGETLAFENGCAICKNCSYSRCG